MKVAVLMGGKSFEREVSLASGKVVCEALEEAGHKVVPLDTNADLVPTLRSERPDVVYNALHGKHGEDGTIQSLLEFLGIPFVGSPASVCHRAWNKDALHSSLAKYRDLTGEEGCASWPQGVYLARDAFKGMGAATALDMVADRVIGGYPVCVKPAHGGSALGVHKVESQEELGEAVLDALSYDEAVNIEQWVDGVELSVSILGTGWDAHALPPVEIVAREGFYDAGWPAWPTTLWSSSAPCATSRFPPTRSMPRPSARKSSGRRWKSTALQRARPRARRPHLGTAARPAVSRWTCPRA